ncbi:hypothetical protein GCM10017562_65890 [Streptomyces roseofulvus]|uniref:DUF6153 family protein n=2 Tax=Streptomyces TaxID=1883 RepID=A0ABU4K6U5_9ACTN|nr:DUF6153 family protein [Streptomyces roseolus]MDX2293484.1 DUF6153 family protein [Streptomyces roseolus]
MPTPRPRHGERAGGALAHLLLVVVLALGVFMMHSTGHPEGPSASHAAAVGTSGAPHAADGGGHGAGAQDEGHAPGSGMDMTTLCVAVLGAWLLAGLVRAALGRRPDWLVLLLARLAPALRPHAPPRRPPDLARLSVLRI